MKGGLCLHTAEPPRLCMALLLAPVFCCLLLYLTQEGHREDMFGVNEAHGLTNPSTGP